MSAERWNTGILCFAIGILSFVGGLAYGLEFHRVDLDGIKQWQPLIGAAMALIAAIIAFGMTWQTQRVAVLIKEQERIDKILPLLEELSNEMYLITSSFRYAYNSLDTLCETIINELNPKGREIGDQRVEDVFPSALNTDHAVLLRNKIRILVGVAAIIVEGGSPKPDSVHESYLYIMVKSFFEFGVSIDSEVEELTERRIAISEHLSRYFSNRRRKEHC